MPTVDDTMRPATPEDDAATDMSPDSLESKIAALRSSIVYRMPFVHGTLPVQTGQKIKLFYGEPDEAHCIDLAQPTVQQLRLLEKACEPATFGPGKMDVDNFSTNYDPTRSGILELVQNELVGKGGSKLVLEMYKLNVYGKDSFFKSHKDTPRGTKSFGTLVMVFPAPHEGGQFLLSSAGNEWTVDAASEILQNGQHHLVYVAFYGDVTHEVRKVTSGHRVTLTWNIFIEEEIPRPLPIPGDMLEYDAVPKEALAALLADERLLPNGGYVAFGLRYEYPVEDRRSLWDLKRHLKGGDAMIQRACEALGLKISLRALYDKDSYWEFEDILGNQCLVDVFSDSDEIVREAGSEPVIDQHGEELKTQEIAWVTEYNKKNLIEGEYEPAYGNDGFQGTVYGTLALFVEVKRP
ncbi:hypothetical protein BD626DRAFT_500060 [Schizophyllum amplum]|uniref:Prolyl 4-hydroxylase alpha subunit Fe(2+) 2OG dioxygenase domain-containing protein n=1 Tax=Schizophyllum amplum TaxID=97359 RepID=A0A550CBT4_9AGAR|nr:hypothetical protein BD626DRAFT_500060 [Auriculariopsis ampla]